MNRQITILRNRIKKFRDNPLALLPFLRKYLIYNYIADYNIPLYRNIHFLNYQETIDQILKKNKSIVRFGDDVFDLLLGIGLYFNDWRQVYQPDLAVRLKEVLSSRNQNLLVCFNPEFILKNKSEFKAEGIGKQFHYWTHSKVYLRNYIDVKQVYGSALSFQDRYNTAIPYDAIIRHLKSRHLVVVASNIARFNNVQLGLTTQYVEAPSSDAWNVYGQLLQQVLQKLNNLPKNETLILSSLGPTSKVMVFDLTQAGYVAWDTGQFFDMALQKLK